MNAVCLMVDSFAAGWTLSAAIYVGSDNPGLAMILVGLGVANAGLSGVWLWATLA